MSDQENVLTPENVKKVFTKCLFEKDEDMTNHVKAEGILHNAAFHPGRLEENRQMVHDMLSELPDGFKVSGGGGQSFLSACMNKDNVQWTGLHMDQEMLFLLGLAIDEVACPLPKDMWDHLPGGMPYYTVLQ